jgi:hypothetical protein
MGMMGLGARVSCVRRARQSEFTTQKGEGGIGPFLGLIAQPLIPTARKGLPPPLPFFTFFLVVENAKSNVPFRV